MKLNVTAGDQAPVDTSWINRRFKQLEQLVQEALAAAGDLTGAVIRRGLLRITGGGGFVIDGTLYQSPFGYEGGFEQFLFGALPDDPVFNRPDGERQMGFWGYRDNGTLAVAIAELRANDGLYRQAFQVFDGIGNTIVSEDTNSGRGLARPHVGAGGLVPTDTSRWLQAVETVWTSVGQREYETTNACVEWNVQTLADAGVTAQYRWIFIVDGNVVQVGGADRVATLTAPAGTYAFGQFMAANVPLPAQVKVNQRYIVQLQIRITAGQDGTKVAKATCLNFGGDQSI